MTGSNVPGEDDAAQSVAEEDRILDALWGDRLRPRRGPKPKLSVDLVVTAGIELADAEGLSGLSVARVAKNLETPLMSLYRYVRSKTELVALMLDSAIGPPPDVQAVERGWRARLEYWARENERVFREHPWALPLATMRRAVGPNEVAWLETGLTILEDVGLDDGEMLQVVLLVNSHARGNAQMAANAGDAAPGGGSLASVYAQIFRQDTAHAQYPVIARLYTGGALERGDESFGLERVLDGVQSYIENKNAD
ncbi:TetR/AcrR family transcriptional regulator [Nocardia sp. BMG51109]|uniref:TetR/AcrR family transcriptional regulator n=1 Tax=Nocardia sp. BMG51109 TaxID=1056816 RepID=UPI0004631CF8|nr:TetR/AcrR family transcriptional regulator [Nocardia sp. BMG51109]